MIWRGSGCCLLPAREKKKKLSSHTHTHTHTHTQDLAAEDDVRKTFYQFDEDQDGRLSTSELARLCHSLGSKLTHNELQAAITSLDANRDGYIQEEEFLRWWRGETELKQPLQGV